VRSMLKSNAIVLALVVGLGIGLGVGVLGTGLANPTPTGAPAATVPTGPAPGALPGTTFAQLAETVKPAVININTTTVRPETRGRPGPRTPFEEFFGEEFFRRFFGDTPERLPQRSLGSGVIIDPSGIALTNAHVVERARAIEVVTVDGRKHRATVVGADRKTDLAVLRLEDGQGQFPHLRLGDSERAQVGDWVIAVGSPFGLQATVTAGIISAKARQIGAGPYDDFLQTDAAINPGNSGGPLVNMQGEVIGINTAIVRGGSGIGFAIPSDMARRISTELLDKGAVTRGWLGVVVQPLTKDLADSFGIPTADGALVAEVMPGSPAATAGLKPGDVIVEVDGKKIDNPGDLARAIGLAEPGRTARLRVWQDKRERTLQITLGQMPAERQTARLGLEVRPVTAELARELNLPTTDGVVVVRVEEGSPAARAGVRRGDVIREVNRQPVRSLAEFERATQRARPGQPLALRLQRGSTWLYVAVHPEAEPRG
jgi:serine protease Do